MGDAADRRIEQPRIEQPRIEDLLRPLAPQVLGSLTRR